MFLHQIFVIFLFYFFCLVFLAKISLVLFSPFLFPFPSSTFFVLLSFVFRSFFALFLSFAGPILLVGVCHVIFHNRLVILIDFLPPLFVFLNAVRRQHQPQHGWIVHDRPLRHVSLSNVIGTRGCALLQCCGCWEVELNVIFYCHRLACRPFP